MLLLRERKSELCNYYQLTLSKKANLFSYIQILCQLLPTQAWSCVMHPEDLTVS